jgi:hypothetical protein
MATIHQEQFMKVITGEVSVIKENKIEQATIAFDDVAYKGYYDTKKFMNVINGEEGGDCFTSSFKTWAKLRKIGAIRVKGKRGLEQRQERSGRKNSWHYWVEAKGMVYDVSSGMTLLMTIENFYKTFEVASVEKAEYVGLFDDELDGMQEDKYDVKRILTSLDTPQSVFTRCYDALVQLIDR